MVPFLGRGDRFPPVELAHPDLGGLVAVGGDLSPERLIDAYRHGIFPWGTENGIPLWYCPEPRMVLFPDEFRLHRSLQKTLQKRHFSVSIDCDFAGVISACASTPRIGQNGTWIDTRMQLAYQRLFELGWAHSVETRMDGELVGGLYGLALGQVFFGESMFSRRTDASKLAFAHLVRWLDARGFALIDCQMYTDHLASLGARLIPRKDFLLQLIGLIPTEPQPSRWPAGPLCWEA